MVPKVFKVAGSKIHFCSSQPQRISVLHTEEMMARNSKYGQTSNLNPVLSGWCVLFSSISDSKSGSNKWKQDPGIWFLWNLSGLGIVCLLVVNLSWPTQMYFTARKCLNQGEAKPQTKQFPLESWSIQARTMKPQLIHIRKQGRRLAHK